MRRLRQLLLALGVLALLGGVVTWAVVYVLIFRDLPEIYALDDYRPNLITRIAAKDGSIIGSLARECIELVTLPGSTPTAEFRLSGVEMTRSNVGVSGSSRTRLPKYCGDTSTCGKPLSSLGRSVLRQRGWRRTLFPRPTQLIRSVCDDSSPITYPTT